MKFAVFALFVAMVFATATANYPGPNCVCTRELAPVCASNGVTYGNKCQFNCAKNQLIGRAAEEFVIARGGECNGPEIPEFTRDLK